MSAHSNEIPSARGRSAWAALATKQRTRRGRAGERPTRRPKGELSASLRAAGWITAPEALELLGLSSIDTLRDLRRIDEDLLPYQKAHVENGTRGAWQSSALERIAETARTLDVTYSVAVRVLSAFDQEKIPCRPPS